jgi:hypothetical protein
MMIQQVLDSEIRPMLIADGGDVSSTMSMATGAGEAPGGLRLLRQQHRHVEVRH